MQTSPSHSRRAFLKSSTQVAVSGALLTLLHEGPSFAASQGQAKGTLLAYVGSFSSPLQDVLPTQVDLPPGNGRGIHIFEVDRKTGALSPRGLYEQGTSPSCLVFNSVGTHLYSANETDKYRGTDAGTVSAFALDKTNGQLKLLNTVSSGGAGPTYLSLHPNGRFLFVANYFGGSIAVLPIHEDGSLGVAIDIQKDAGTLGPRKATNAPPGSFAFSGHDVPHAHMIAPDPAGKFVLSVDLALDQILIWKFNDKEGKLTPNDQESVTLPPGDGPRHFSFHPNGRWFYSIQEEGSNIVLFDYDAANGKLSSRQTISSLPPGFAGSNFCSEIMVSANGQFLYAGNRLHDSIGIFSIGKTGELAFLGEEWTRGDYPRSFNFDPSGDFLYSCNQRGDNIASFRVDKKSGKLEFTGQYTAVGNPSIIVFQEFGSGQ